MKRPGRHRLPKGCVEDMDRHGKVRIYFRAPGKPKVRIRAPFPTPAFFAEVLAASEGRAPPAKRQGKAQPPQGSLRAAVLDYYASPSFRQLAPRTQRVRRGILDAFCAASDGAGGERGALSLTALGAAQVRRFRDAKQDRPEAANALVKALRCVFVQAVHSGLTAVNPAIAVPYLQSKNPGGYMPWSNADVTKFEACHGPGTTARLALRLLLCTGQRRGDVVKLGLSNIEDGGLAFVQEKTGEHLWVPITAALREELDRLPPGSTFIRTAFGQPFSSAGFGNRFRDWCDEAGLPGLSSHGLRKLQAARLAEAGATEKEIAAITGHRSLKEVARYTKSANQRRMASSAIAKLEGQSVNEVVPLAPKVRVGGTKERAKVLKAKENKK